MYIVTQYTCMFLKQKKEKEYKVKKVEHTVHIEFDVNTRRYVLKSSDVHASMTLMLFVGTQAYREGWKMPYTNSSRWGIISRNVSIL